MHNEYSNWHHNTCKTTTYKLKILLADVYVCVMFHSQIKIPKLLLYSMLSTVHHSIVNFCLMYQHNNELETKCITKKAIQNHTSYCLPLPYSWVNGPTLLHDVARKADNMFRKILNNCTLKFNTIPCPARRTTENFWRGCKTTYLPVRAADRLKILIAINGASRTFNCN